MKHKLLLYGLSAAVAGTIIWACQRERIGGEDPGAVEPTLTVAEARDFFEYQYSETLPYRTKLSADRPTGLMPGDFTPRWDKARIGANREMDGADVPIDPRFVFVAVFDRLNERGDTVRQRVEATQKLVVKKWRDSEEYEAFCYIATIVPTPEHYARQKNIEKEFRYAGSKGRFSGFVFYQTLRGELVAATSYREGQPTRHAYFPQITPENADSVATVMDDLTGPVSIQGLSARFKGDQEDPLIADEVIVTGSQNRPWHITITIQPSRPTGLPNPNPIDLPTYQTPIINHGGGGNNTNTTITIQGKPTEFKLDCNSNEIAVKNASEQLLTWIQNCSKNVGLKNSVSFSDFQQAIANRPDVEHSTTLRGYVDNSGGLALDPIQHASHPDSGVKVFFDKRSLALLHSHPSLHLTQPSGSDVWALANVLNASPNMQASFVFVGTEIYCLQVTDPDKAKAFAKNNQLNGHDFDPGCPAGRAWKDAQGYFSAMTRFSDNERASAALAYVLEKTDAGIMLSRKGSNDAKFQAYSVRKDSRGKYYPTKCQ